LRARETATKGRPMAQALLVEIPEVRGGGKAEIEIEATKVR
jgi:hypothetical protein